MQKSFLEYMTDRTLIEFIIKERVKCARKGKLSGERTSKLEDAKNIQDAVRTLTPPRNTWRRPRKLKRQYHKSLKARDMASLRSTIRHDFEHFRDNPDAAPQYLKELKAFIAKVQDMARGNDPLDFGSCIKVQAKWKKDQGDDAIYRPISVYDSIHVKALVSIASQYLTFAAEDCLHEEILSYRPAREYHGKKDYKTEDKDAIAGLKVFAAEHSGEDIYIAECDIQKFYDVFNHDVILRCFRDMAHEVQIPSYHEVERILKAYLDSFSFESRIMALNDDDQYWEPYRAAHSGAVKGKCRFDWVKDEDFLISYKDIETLEASKRKIGIPQGGALSCVIANVVLNDVDRKAGLATKSPDKFFVRYGDDILLAHTDHEECTRLINAYISELENHHLPYHPFKPLASCKDGVKSTKEFWDIKSKAPFRWGSGEGNAFEWIGFVGYEMRYTGELRLRLSTLQKKFNIVNKKYHNCILEGEPNNFESFMVSNYGKIKDIAESFNFDELTWNPYSIQQVKSLDRYRLTKIERLQAKLMDRFHKTSQKYGVPIDLVARFVHPRGSENKDSFYSKLYKITAKEEDSQ